MRHLQSLSKNLFYLLTTESFKVFDKEVGLFLQKSEVSVMKARKSQTSDSVLNTHS